MAIPAEVAVMKCKGHQKLQTDIAAGNNAADEAAKKAGGYTPKQMVLRSEELPELKEEDIIRIQAQAGLYEQSMWKRKGATEKEGLWRSHGRIVAPAKLCHLLLKQAHGPAHESKKRTQMNMEACWWQL